MRDAGAMSSTLITLVLMINLSTNRNTRLTSGRKNNVDAEQLVRFPA